MKHYIVEAIVSVRVQMPVIVEDFDALTNAVNEAIKTLTFSESSTYSVNEKEVVELLYDETDVVDWNLQDED